MSNEVLKWRLITNMLAIRIRLTEFMPGSCFKHQLLIIIFASDAGVQMATDPIL
jgi:hypothetical protein